VGLVAGEGLVELAVQAAGDDDLLIGLEGRGEGLAEPPWMLTL